MIRNYELKATTLLLSGGGRKPLEDCTPVSLVASTDRRSGRGRAAISPACSDEWSARTAGKWLNRRARWDLKGRSVC